MSDREKDQPAASEVDGTSDKYPEPPGATSVAPETESGTKGGGTAEWECLSCGRRFSEDHGTCPDDGAPLRKTGPAAGPVAGKTSESSANIEKPASRAQDTPEGFEGAGTATRGDEPNQGPLGGER